MSFDNMFIIHPRNGSLIGSQFGGRECVRLARRRLLIRTGPMEDAGFLGLIATAGQLFDWCGRPPTLVDGVRVAGGRRWKRLTFEQIIKRLLTFSVARRRWCRYLIDTTIWCFDHVIQWLSHQSFIHWFGHRWGISTWGTHLMIVIYSKYHNIQPHGIKCCSSGRVCAKRW